MNGINVNEHPAGKPEVNEHLLDGPNDYIKIKPNPLLSYTKSFTNRNFRLDVKD